MKRVNECVNERVNERVNEPVSEPVNQRGRVSECEPRTVPLVALRPPSAPFIFAAQSRLAAENGKQPASSAARIPAPDCPRACAPGTAPAPPRQPPRPFHASILVSATLHPFCIQVSPTVPRGPSPPVVTGECRRRPPVPRPVGCLSPPGHALRDAPLPGILCPSACHPSRLVRTRSQKTRRKVSVIVHGDASPRPCRAPVSPCHRVRRNAPSSLSSRAWQATRSKSTAKADALPLLRARSCVCVRAPVSVCEGVECEYAYVRACVCVRIRDAARRSHTAPHAASLRCRAKKMSCPLRRVKGKKKKKKKKKGPPPPKSQ